MSKYKVDITNLNTNDIKVLSNTETINLFKRLRSGEDVKDEIVNGNLKLVLSMLKRFPKDKHNMDDLFQIGCIGLIKAVDNFDLAYNCAFSTYAVPLILGEIKRYIRDNTSLRISRSIKDLSYQILSFKESYYNEYGIEASSKVITDHFHITEYDLNEALDSLKTPMSIFEPIYNDGGDTIYLEDQIADKKEKNKDRDMLISLRKALTKIKERERNILLERFIVGKTQMEIAESLNISQAQVSRLEKNAINNVRKLIK